MSEGQRPGAGDERTVDNHIDIEPGRRMFRLPRFGADRAPRTISFIPRTGTWILLIFLVGVWPGIGLTALILGGDMSLDLTDPINYIILPTIIIEWLIFLAVVLGIVREKASFASIGLVAPKLSDIPTAIAFLLVSNFILLLLQLILSVFGLNISRDVGKLVESVRDSVGWWLAISITAAVCEEVTFRGYILTRIQGLFPKTAWVPAVFFSTAAFAMGHGYQGVAGLIVLFVYGLMFCGIYLYTGSLWPAILAHFIQDFSAIFLYDYVDF